MVSVRLVGLDVARAIAIFLALGWHFYTPTGIVIVDLLQEPGRAIGWAGVDLFFVLSGFLVGGLIFGEIHRTGHFNAKRFLIRRAFKIWPVLYLYIALVVVTGRYGFMEVVPQTVLHVQNFWTTPIHHLWSLAVEEHFYLVFAVASAFTSVARGNVSRVPVFLWSVILGAPVLRAIAVLLGVESFSIQAQTQFRADALAAGVFLAYAKVFRPELFARIVGARVLLLCVAVAATSIVVMVSRDKQLVATLGYSATILASGSLVLLLLGARSTSSPGLMIRAVAWVGTYSYALYVYQFVMFRVLETVWKKIIVVTPSAPTVLAMKYLGALFLAFVVTKAVERPALALRNRLFPT